jgi:hypothetical protein
MFIGLLRMVQNLPFLRRKGVVAEGLKNRCEHSRFHLCEVKAQCLVS